MPAPCVAYPTRLANQVSAWSCWIGSASACLSGPPLCDAEFVARGALHHLLRRLVVGRRPWPECAGLFSDIGQFGVG
eukprot:4065577-Pyramimonas_sp.AAC.1